MSWAEAMVEELAELKAAGWEFDQAWRAAVRDHPPRGIDRGRTVTALFEDEEHPEPVESLVDFLRRVADDAWHDRRPLLRPLGGLLEMIEGLEAAAVARKAAGPRGSRDRLVA